jgi:hypothetical protein
VEISWLEPAVFATSRLLLYLYAEHVKRMVQAKHIAAILMAACLSGCGYAILDTDAPPTISEKASVLGRPVAADRVPAAHLALLPK